MEGWKVGNSPARSQEFFFKEASVKVAVNLLHKHRARVFKNFLAFWGEILLSSRKDH